MVGPTRAWGSPPQRSPSRRTSGASPPCEWDLVNSYGPPRRRRPGDPRRHRLQERARAHPRRARRDRLRPDRRHPDRADPRHSDHAGGVAAARRRRPAPGVLVHIDDAEYGPHGHAHRASTDRSSCGRIMRNGGEASAPPRSRGAHDGQVVDVGGRTARRPHARALAGSREPAARADPAAHHRRRHLEHPPAHAWPIGGLCTNFAQNRSRPPRSSASSTTTSSAFTHGPEIREGAREAVRGFLRGSQGFPGRVLSSCRKGLGLAGSRRAPRTAAAGVVGVSAADVRRSCGPRPSIARHRVGASTPRAVRRRRHLRASGPLEASPEGPDPDARPRATPPPPDSGADPARHPRRADRAGPGRRGPRPVELRNSSVVGAQTSDLDGQIDDDRGPRGARPRRGADRRQRRHPRGLPAASVRHLAQAVRRLRELGAEVVARHLPRPRHGAPDPAPAPAHRPALVPPARRRPDDHASSRPVAARCPWAPCSARSSTRDPGSYFSEDRFHPSSLGYRALRRGPAADGLRRARLRRPRRSAPSSTVAQPRGGPAAGRGRRRGGRAAGTEVVAACRSTGTTAPARGAGPSVPDPVRLAAHRSSDDARGRRRRVPDGGAARRQSGRAGASAQARRRRRRPRGSSPSPDAGLRPRSVPVTATWSADDEAGRGPGTVRRSAAPRP